MPRIRPGHPGRNRLRRAALVAVVATASLTAASTASAIGTEYSFSFSTFPGDYDWDGAGTAPAPSFGDYSASVYQPYADSGTEACFAKIDADTNSTSCKTQQVRAGAVIPARDATDTLDLPITLTPGDVIQSVNKATGAVVASTTFGAPQPVIASPTGSTNFTIGRAANTNTISVALLRRVPRTVLRYHAVPGTYHYVQEMTGSDTNDTVDYCYLYDPAQRGVVKVTDAIPAAPTTPATAGNTYYLVRDTDCTVVTDKVQGNPYETISTGRLTALADTTASGSFGVPMQAGDLIAYSEATDSTTNDVRTSIDQTNYAPVGTVPPAPVVKAFTFGAPNTTIKAFTKGGMFTFFTLDLPGTVTEQLTIPAAKSKSKSKKKKKKSKAPVVIGTGTAATIAPGQTVRVGIFSTKAGRKALKALKGKPAKATLTTTITDAFGHVVVSSSAVKLSGK